MTTVFPKIITTGNGVTIYIATNPTNENSSFIDDIMKDESVLVTHPFFDLNSGYGKKVQSIIVEGYQPCDDKWEDIINKDLWMIRNCDLFAYDIDSNPGLHLIGAALAYNKPIIGLSSEMKGVSEHIFSKKFLAIIKHLDLAKYYQVFCHG